MEGILGFNGRTLGKAAFQSLSVAVHQGMVYIPLGYQIQDITNLDEVHGGSPWGTSPLPIA
jgi:hypothetical protein